MAHKAPRIPRDEPLHPLICLAAMLGMALVLWALVILAARALLS